MAPCWGSALPQGAMNGAPTPISRLFPSSLSHALYLKCIDHKGRPIRTNLSSAARARPLG